MHPIVSLPVDLDERLRALEGRILDLAARVEPLFDIRAAADARDGADLDAMLSRLKTLGDAMRGRESAGSDWDAVDQLTARVMLLTLAAVAVELRRRANEGGARLAAGRTQLADLRRAFEAFEREISAPDEGADG